jgi:nucleotide-binding universal stress UspA family protein
VKRVLVAYDGSAAARRALDHAGELARPGDRVTVVNVMPEPGVGARLGPPAEERNRQSLLLGEARRLLAVRGIEADLAAPVGDPAAEIVAAADELGADLIVVGRHRSRSHHLLGSVSDHIVRAANRDVLVIHAAGTDGGPGR